MSNYRPSPFPQLTPVVKNLLIINVIFFLATQLFGSVMSNLVLYYPFSPFFKIWQPVTYMFMHAGFSHILFNMFGLITFGSTLESYMGSKRFLNFYLVCGLGAALVQSAVQGYMLYSTTGTVYTTLELGSLGASGSVTGLLVAFAMLFPNVELMMLFFPVPIKAKYFIPGMLLLELYTGINPTPGDNVGHFAHLGGALFGFILVKIWRSNHR